MTQAYLELHEMHYNHPLKMNSWTWGGKGH